MAKRINIELINKILKPKEGNTFVNGILRIIYIILLPIIVVIGLLIMIFAIIISAFQKTKMTKEEKDDFEKDLNTTSIIENWTIWTGNNGLKVYHKFKGEIRFGPAYLSLKSEPKISDLNDRLFGDWFFQYKDGLLLQEWNSTDSPDSNLVYLDCKKRKTQIVQENIPSVLWDIVKTENQALLLTCDTGSEILKYEITI